MATSTVASAATSTQLLAANAQRRTLIIENSDANTLYVLLNSGTASSGNFSFSLAQNANKVIDGYTGEVVGIWSVDGAGSAHITEY